MRPHARLVRLWNCDSLWKLDHHMIVNSATLLQFRNPQVNELHVAPLSPVSQLGQVRRDIARVPRLTWTIRHPETCPLSRASADLSHVAGQVNEASNSLPNPPQPHSLRVKGDDSERRMS